MDKFDIINLYQQGYTVNFIVNAYYKYKKDTSRNIYNVRDKVILIIKKDSIKKEDCRRYVEKVLFDYLYNTNSVEHFL